MFAIREDDLTSGQTRALLTIHLASMHAISPPGSVFALDLGGLQLPDVTVWSAWSDDHIASIGALNMLNGHSGEIKSMRTHPDFLRMGAAAALLDHIIMMAERRGIRRLSLETGSGPAFQPAIALYRRRGFENGNAFSDYQPSGFNQFMHLDL